MGGMVCMVTETVNFFEACHNALVLACPVVRAEQPHGCIYPINLSVRHILNKLINFLKVGTNYLQYTGILLCKNYSENQNYYKTCRPNIKILNMNMNKETHLNYYEPFFVI